MYTPMSKEPISDAGAIVVNSSNGGSANLPLALDTDYSRTRDKVLPKLLRVAGRIPFADDLAAAYYCAIDARTPKKAKGVLFAAMAYFVLPADMVPDVLAGLGFTDDATVLATALGVVGAHVQPRHRQSARRLLKLPEPDAQDD